MNNSIEQQVEALGIEEYLKQHQNKSLLKFLTCGSVDDGKSSLIGRLLHDSFQIYEDQLAAVHADSHKVGTTGRKPDLALLVDGLQAEREQGITIDVAYRYFSTKKRKFIISDTPGHEQYTRNMATGASTCDLAVILIDARKGILDQTRRHSYIANLLGIRHFIVAVNKMDLVDFQEDRFVEIKEDYLSFSEKLNADLDIQFVPLSALDGDNVVKLSKQTPWYQGESLLYLLENVDINKKHAESELRFPVQYVNRPNLDFRGFAGTLASGTIKVGDQICVLPSGKISQIDRIVTFDGDLQQASTGQAITITLTDEIDISRGDMIVAVNSTIQSSNHILADIVWMSEQPPQLSREYDIKVASKKMIGNIERIHHQLNINNIEAFPSNSLPLNGIGQCELSLTESVPFDRYQTCPKTGGFIIIDRLSNVTVAAGMISEILSENKPQIGEVDSFEIELKALIHKHFPFGNGQDLRHTNSIK